MPPCAFIRRMPRWWKPILPRRRRPPTAAVLPAHPAARVIAAAAHTANARFFTRYYVLSGIGADAKLQPVQIKTGISDGISTEVLAGLDEGAQVVTGVALAGAQAARPANPFGGGFPRMR